MATSVGTAQIVNDAAVTRKVQGAYLIQHFEDFAISAEKVLETWRYPLKRIVVSRWLQNIAETHGLSSTLVENGIDSEVFSSGRPIQSRAPIVLAMVSDQYFKRTDLVIESFNRLAANGSGAILRTFGACSRPLGLSEAVDHFKDPPQPELVALYQEAQIFLCASDYEGFGLPALEAMSCGAVVVTTDNGGVPSFSDGTAVVVPVGECQPMVTEIQGLLESQDRLVELATAGHARALELDVNASFERFEAALLGL
ncbi:glycosyltransferase family 4 protein [Mycolicibacterium sp. A43C]